MTLLKELVIELSLRKGILPPSVFSPLSYELGAKVLSAAHAEQIGCPWKQKGVGVNNFWQSSRNPHPATLDQADVDSAWGLVMQQAFVA